MSAGGDWLRHPLLEALDVAHGFGTRGSPAPAGLLRPRQVHGAHVWVNATATAAAPGEADAIVSAEPARAVGIATADCLPILLASRDGELVAAVHAGWRGLAQGVIPAAVATLGRLAGGRPGLVAALGPHIGPCCYEVDEPVLGPLRERFGAGFEPALGAGRPGHAWLDLGALGRVALLEAGLDPADIGLLPDACTHCDARRFHSYRRDGPRAGRLLHFVAARAAQTKS